MPWMMVVQPNKKYAAFSSEVNNFVAVDMTHEEAEDWVLQEALFGSSPPGRPPLRLAQMNASDKFLKLMETILRVHGQAEHDRLMEELSADTIPPQEVRP